MRITLIASDENTAPLYRVRMLARLLARDHEVEVLGFHSDPSRLDPQAPRDFDYRSWRMRPWPRFWADARDLAEAVHGEVIYAMKPRPTSFGLALALRRWKGLPVVVDVDDWEPYMVSPFSRHPLKNAAYALPRLRDPNNYLALMACDRLIRQADGVTTVSNHLRERYGGVIVPQYVDVDSFDPERWDPEPLRQRHGLERHTVAVFAGIAQPNKGVAEVLEAFQALGNRQDWRLVIVGPRTPHARELAARDARVLLMGTQPPEATPAFLRMADLVVLPQRAEPASAGQMPMKLFEAMAMAAPIVATATADIPRLLAGCGWVVPPGDRDALVQALLEVLGDPAAARRKGLAARRRILARYGYAQGAERLNAVMEAARHRQAPAVLGGASC